MARLRRAIELYIKDIPQPVNYILITAAQKH